MFLFRRHSSPPLDFWPPEPLILSLGLLPGLAGNRRGPRGCDRLKTQLESRARVSVRGQLGTLPRAAGVRLGGWGGLLRHCPRKSQRGPACGRVDPAALSRASRAFGSRETRCFWPWVSVQCGAHHTQVGNGVLGRVGRGRPCPERLSGTGRSAGEDGSVFTLCCCPGSPASERQEHPHPLPAMNVSGTTEMTLAVPMTDPRDVASNRGQGGLTFRRSRVLTWTCGRFARRRLRP